MPSIAIFSLAKPCKHRACQEWSNTVVPGRVPIPFLSPHYYMLLNTFSTVYLKINKTKDWGWRSSTWRTQGRRNPCCCCWGKGGHPCWACQASRAGCGEWPVPRVHSTGLIWATSHHGERACCISAILSILHCPSVVGFSSTWLHHSMSLQQRMLIWALKCHSF